MNRHCIFLSFFIIFSGTVVFSSCAKKSDSVSTRQVYAEAEHPAGAVKNAAYAKDATCCYEVLISKQLGKRKLRFVRAA